MSIKNALRNLLYIFKKKNYIPIYRDVIDSDLLKGKVALITGGTGGIGFDIAIEFLNCGCDVIVAGTNKDKLSQISKKYPKIKTLNLDLNDLMSFKSKVEIAHSYFGKIDILVNCAGVHIMELDDFLKVTPDQYDFIMDINLKGMYFLTQEVAKAMIKDKIKGHILNISSNCALEPAWSPYRLSKWGVRGLTEGLAQKLIDYNIIVNGIAPGAAATNMQNYGEGKSIYSLSNSKKRLIMPREISQYAKFLVSDLGDMVVGDTLYITGGRGIIEIQ